MRLQEIELAEELGVRNITMELPGFIAGLTVDALLNKD